MFRSGHENFIQIAMTSLIFAALLFLIGLKAEGAGPRPAPLKMLQSVLGLR